MGGKDDVDFENIFSTIVITLHHFGVSLRMKFKILSGGASGTALK
jgi:hypothetical protein